MAEQIKITIDGKEWDVDSGKNVLQCILDAGQVIPHFCYHEALGSLGACRLCAAMVAPAADKPGRLEMTCMVRATPGMVVDVNAPYAKNFRKGVIEGLMLNHPHDCPVCDEGGECMLQDMTVMSEHQHRRMRFSKRTWENQYLGPLIHHEMNRCITCYRCVRYYREYSLGDDLGVYGSRDRVYFGRFEPGRLESEFAGNLLDVCPTGVFTNKRFRESYVRPWDLSTAKSVCVNCSVGCTVLPGFRHSTLRRVKPLENAAVNRWFMCDRGRFGGEFVNHESRLTGGRVDRRNVSAEQSQEALGESLAAIAQNHKGSVVGFGSPRASLEANAALSLLVHALGGRMVYFADDAERNATRRAAALTVAGNVPIASLSDMEKADAVLVLGGDLTGEAPMFDLSVRQAIRANAPVFIASPRKGRLDEFARATIRTVPGSEAQIASWIRGQVSGFPAASMNGETDFVRQVSEVLGNAKNPLILASAASRDAALVDAAHALALALNRQDRPSKLAFWFSGPNSLGIGLSKSDVAPSAVRKDLLDGKVRGVIALERDLSLDFNGLSDLGSHLQACDLVATIDALDTLGAQASSIVVPCVSHYQGFGTFLNYEGRAQRYEGLHIPGTVTQTSSEVLLGLMQQLDLLGKVPGTEFHDVYDVAPELSAEMEGLTPGTAGVRVRLSQNVSTEVIYEAAPVAASSSSLRGWRVTHTFGSEELSSLSPPAAELAPSQYLEIHPEDAAALGLTEGADGKVTTEAGELSGTVRFAADLHRGVVCSPILRVAAPAAEGAVA